MKKLDKLENLIINGGSTPGSPYWSGYTWVRYGSCGSQSQGTHVCDNIDDAPGGEDEEPNIEHR